MTAPLFLPALWQAIRTRLTGDATLVALLGSSGASNITVTFPFPAVDPSGGSYPKITINPVSVVPDDTFPDRRQVCTLELHIWVEEITGTDAEQTTSSLLRLAKIHERVLGDWPYQLVNVQPTYGLDRWKPDFSAQTGDGASDYEAEQITHVDPGMIDLTDSDSGLRHWQLVFRCALNKTRPTS